MTSPVDSDPFFRLFEDRRYAFWFYLLGTAALGGLAWLLGALHASPPVVACIVAVLVIPFHFLLDPIYEYWTMRSTLKRFLDSHLEGKNVGLDSTNTSLKPLRRKLYRSRRWMLWFLGIVVALQLYFVQELLAAFALFALSFVAIALMTLSLYFLQRLISRIGILEHLLDLSRSGNEESPKTARNAFGGEAR